MFLLRKFEDFYRASIPFQFRSKWNGMSEFFPGLTFDDGRPSE